MTTHLFFWFFVVVFFVHEIFESVLILLNNAHIRKHQDQIPPFFQDKIDRATYQKGIRYNLERSRFALRVQWLGIAIFWAAIFGGAFEKLDLGLMKYSSPNTLTHAVLYCLAFGLILTLLGIPTSLYSHFVIEEKYGFNKMTAKTFVIDLFKGLFLGAAFGVPLLYLLFWLYQVSGPYWWLWAFLAFFGFELLMAAIYPTILAPLFNKFIPLPEGSLKEAIYGVARKIGFKMSGIYTIDGSKRSTHSNAYFAGLGRMRRIVLFDTLVSGFTEPEIISVLAHEMGHNKKRHIQKQLFLSFIFGLAGFWLLSLLIHWPPLFAALNAGNPEPYKALVLLSLIASHFTFFLTPFSNYLSRKYEYEADRFSKEVIGESQNMVSALTKLSTENLSNLTPHPLYSFYHYTHPTTLERIQALKNS